MTNYPNGLDDIVTLPTVSGSDPEPTAINALRDACYAIEKELGIVPSGVYSDVRARLDILESRINFGVSPSIPNDGYVLSPLYIWNTSSNVTLSISDGYGVPTENRVNGSLYMRADGYVNQDLYIRRDGYWVPIQTQPWVAGGDLAGTDTSQTVIGWYGKKLRPTMATIGALHDGYHPTWNNVDGYWEAQTGFIPGRDLGQFSGPYGRTGQTVIGIWNRNIASTAPGGSTSSDGDSLAWDPTLNQWQPRARAIIFDGYVARSSLRSNKLLQSPIDNTKTGIVNFGSRSSGTTVGATADYAAILSGDRHTATGTYSLVLGGDSHTASAQFATVGNGSGNTASAQYATSINGTLNVASGVSSFIGNGTSNTANSTQSVVLDGYSNVAGAINTFVINGGLNQALGNYSGILNGGTNVISSTSPHALIGMGTNNTITNFANYSIIMGGSGNTSNAANTFMGTSTDGYVRSIYSVILNGLTHSIGTSSQYSVILSGQVNTIANSSTYGFVGTGNNISVTGAYATVLNSTTATANGLHTLILNGNTNFATGQYTTVVNGNNNTANANYAIILDGYSHNVTGLYGAVLGGNTNIVAGTNSVTLNGSNNSIDSGSLNSVVLNGIANTLTNSTGSLVLGNNNTLSANMISVIGNSNNVSAANARAFGSFNTITSISSAAFGSSNTVAGSLGFVHVFGQSNTTTSGAGYATVKGLNNTSDGYHSHVFGERNLVTSTGYYSLVTGRYARARISGQRAHAVVNFNGTNAGEAQYSRVLLSGSGLAGTAFPCIVANDGYLTFEDGKAYDITIRVLLVNNQPTLVDPTRPARFVYDLLASQEAGTLTIHDQNDTLINQNGTGWTVTIGTSGNQLLVNVNQATFPSSPVPFNSSNRRAFVTVEWRELTRA